MNEGMEPTELRTGMGKVRNTDQGPQEAGKRFSDDSTITCGRREA